MMIYIRNMYGKLSEKLIVENGNTSIDLATPIIKLTRSVSMNPNMTPSVSETYELSKDKRLSSIASGTNGITITFATSA